ncbi:MAG TPA: pirin family protein [Puia sp.]|jgi:redox-sensitive bicupin YhaK (pirin superfamily)|nr:pirin family protein [Puia sp.]
MTNIFHPAPERGHVDYGWLDSHHSFSFGNWYDGDKVHFGALRVLNDDTVKGGNGFDSELHENMEIISIPLKGTLAQRDSPGTEGILSTGDVRIMSPGSGNRHSEYNASHFDPVNFLQIWIFPKQLNIKPRLDKKRFDPAGRVNQWQFVVSPRPEDGGLFINQEARLALARLDAGMTIRYDNAFAGNGVYVFVLTGSVEIGDAALSNRDGLGITGADSFTIRALAQSELLAIEVPMFA